MKLKFKNASPCTQDRTPFVDDVHIVHSETSTSCGWVGDIDTLDEEVQTLLESTIYDKECLDFTFTGGLSEKFMGEAHQKPVKFFEQPNVVFSYLKTGEGCGWTSTSVNPEKVCEKGMRV